MPIQISSVCDHIITLNPTVNADITKRSLDFANDLGMKKSAQHYEQRRNANSERTTLNIAHGKKCEYMVLHYLMEKYKFPFVEVDVEIRSGNQKGWVPDLEFSKISKDYTDVHVKSCDDYTLRHCGQWSWTFQFSDGDDSPGGKDPLFTIGKPQDLVAFVYLPFFEHNTATIKAIAPWHKINKYLEEPYSGSLIKFKKCIYYVALYALKNNIENLKC